MQVSPQFSAVPSQVKAGRANVEVRQPVSQPHVQFGKRNSDDDLTPPSSGGQWKKGPLAALALLLSGLGLVSGLPTFDSPNKEIATVKNADGVTEGYIEPGGKFKGRDVHGFVYQPDSLLGDDVRLPFVGDLFDDKNVGVVVDGRAYDAEGSLVCTTGTGFDKTIKLHEQGEPVGTEVGRFEAVAGGTVFKDQGGVQKGTTTRKLQNETYNISPNNQAAAACLLGTIGPDEKVQNPQPNQKIENGKVVKDN